MAKTIQYQPIKGWFDLSKLNLPRDKFKKYAELQVFGEHYQRTLQYQKEHNSVQLEHLKMLCAEMNIDLILNYGALEQEDES